MADSNEASEAKVSTVDTPKTNIKSVPSAPDFLPTGRMKLAEHLIQIYSVTVPFGTKFDQIMQPGYWRQETQKLRIGTHLYVEPDDGCWFGWLKVIDVDKSGAKVSKLLYTDVAGYGKSEIVPGYKVDFAGPINRWRVTKGDGNDSVELKNGFVTRGAANKFAMEHAERMS